MPLNRRLFPGSAATTATLAALAARSARAQDGSLPNVTIWVQSGPEAEALQAVADAYTKAAGNPVTIGVQGRSGWRQRYETALATGSVMGSFLGNMGSFGDDFLDANGCVVTDSPEMIATWTKFIEMKNVHEVTPPDINAWDYRELLVRLQNGTPAQASFLTAGMPILTDCEQTPKLCLSPALVTQPAGPAGSRTRANPLGFMVNASSPNKDATWGFLKFATGKEGSTI